MVMYRSSPAMPLKHADVRASCEAVEGRAERRVVLRVLGDEDELFDRDVLGVFVAALVPSLRDAQAPALLQGTAGTCWARRGAAPCACSVLPRVSTERFCSTIASASEQSTSFDGMPHLIRLTMSVSANTPHLAAT